MIERVACRVSRGDQSLELDGSGVVVEVINPVLRDQLHPHEYKKRGGLTQQSALMGMEEVSPPSAPLAVNVNFCSPTPIGILKTWTPG